MKRFCFVKYVIYDIIVGTRCHELRITDMNVYWRIVYRIDVEAIVLLEVFAKKTSKTPKRIIDLCKNRIREYDSK